MTESAFDTLARDAESRQGRRNALKAFGAAALATIVGLPMATEAKRNGKNRKRNNRKRNKDKNGGVQVCPECPAEDCTQEAEQAAEARCLSQVATCEQEVRELCERNNNDPESEDECLDEILPCCQSLGTCDVNAFFACIAPEPEAGT